MEMISKKHKRSLTRAEIKRIQLDLHGIIEEWLGGHIPNEGTEDHDSWQSMEMDLEDCKAITNFVDFLECRHIELESYFDSLDVDKILANATNDEEHDDPERLEQFKQYYLG